MKIELVDENRIKAVLSCYDILELNFDVSMLGENNAEAKTIMEDILKKADERFGFYADVDKIFVEAVPSAKEGYVIYITKSNEELSTTKRESNAFVVLSFIDFETLRMAVEAYTEAFFGSVDLFLLDGRYYLVFDSSYEKERERVAVIMAEFGDRIIDSAMLTAILNEYGKLIYKKNAIKMIKNKKN